MGKATQAQEPRYRRHWKVTSDWWRIVYQLRREITLSDGGCPPMSQATYDSLCRRAGFDPDDEEVDIARVESSQEEDVRPGDLIVGGVQSERVIFREIVRKGR